MTSISETAATSETKPAGDLIANGHVPLRAFVAGGYLGLALSGAISTDGRVLLASAPLIGLYLCALTLQSLSMRPFAWLRAATPYFDGLTITSVIVATGDAGSPAWAFYLISLAAAAHVAGRREMVIHVAWSCLNYLFAALLVQAMGHDVSWGYAAVVLAAIVLAGLNAGIINGVGERLHHVVARAATTDALTGLPNRHAFRATYVASIEEAIGRRMPMALMLIDVDNFHQVNDSGGQAAGDAKLLDVAHLLESSLRRGDLVARYGGHEFVVIAPYTTRPDATTLAERLRAGAGRIDASLSIGVALFPEDAAHADALLNAAGDALDRARQAGRNCVRAAQAA